MALEELESYSKKTLKGDHGEIEIAAHHDRDASFGPQIVRKGQARITGMDDQILSLYAKGMPLISKPGGYTVLFTGSRKSKLLTNSGYLFSVTVRYLFSAIIMTTLFFKFYSLNQVFVFQ